MASKKFSMKITHRFLKSGHSYSEARSMHARIEKKETLKDIFGPEECFTLIKEYKQNGKSNKVVHL